MSFFQYNVLDLNNNKVDTVELLEDVFKVKDINKHLIWEAVRYHLAKKRSGTASTKAKCEVSGSGRKLWKQKGTGRARIGSIRSALWRGGSTVHGPKPRDYSYAFPKNARRSALRSTLSIKLLDGKIIVVNDWSIDNLKTKSLITVLCKLGISGSVLLVGTEESRNVVLAANNNPKVTTSESLSVNVYDLLKHDQVIFSKKAILALQKVVKL